jgi:multicomponent Na+:H+ antiporter subunit G
MLTAPVAAHLVGRAGYRTGKVRRDLLVVDELTEAQERADRRAGDAASSAPVPSSSSEDEADGGGPGGR